MPNAMNLKIIASYSNNVQIELTIKEYIAIASYCNYIIYTYVPPNEHP